jgi:hypothetical protein
MSTFTRRKKVAEARKAARPTVTVAAPLFEEPTLPKPRTRASNGNGAKPKASAATRVREAKPIYANLNLVGDYVFTDHAIERMGSRNIAPAEVYSALANPDYVTSNKDSSHESDDDHDASRGDRVYDRGDVRVVVDSENRSIVTVTDLNSANRTEPRIPLTANLVVPEVIPAVLPDVDKPTQRVPKELPESEEMKWLFGKHLKKDVRFIDISPAVARSLLDRNTRNRKKSQIDIADWSKEMKAGRWRETSQGIGIARDGIIVDGQHRLEAIVDSGVTVNMVVVVGLDPEVFTVTDVGRRRTSGDALGMVGESSTTQLAAIVRLAYEFDSLLGGPRINRKGRIHHDVLLAYRSGKEEQLREATKACQNVRAFGLPVNKTAFGVAYYLVGRDGNDQDLADEFFEGVRSGISLTGTDPRYVLRRVIFNDETTRRSSIANRHLALILKAWALFVRGEGCRTLSWRIDEEMPVVYRSRTAP